MHVAGGHLILDLRGDGVGLADLLRLQTLPLEHVVEVGVAAEIELVGPVDLHTAVAEQAREHTMDNCCADLGLDVVADDRRAGAAEPIGPVLLAGNEDGDAVDESAAGLEHLLDVPFGRFLRADRQVVDHDIDIAVLEDLGHVDC